MTTVRKKTRYPGSVSGAGPRSRRAMWKRSSPGSSGLTRKYIRPESGKVNKRKGHCPLLLGSLELSVVQGIVVDQGNTLEVSHAATVDRFPINAVFRAVYVTGDAYGDKGALAIGYAPESG